jgi:cell division protein FtsQ
MSPPSGNKRRPDAPRPKTVSAPPDPIVHDPRDDSPLPGPATTTVRPPRPSAAPKPGQRPAGAIGRLARTFQLVGGVAVVLAASISVAWGARRYLTTSPRFAVRTVLVDGERRRSAAHVAEMGGLAVGKNIFALDLALAGAMIAEDPWIEKATVTRKLPSTVTVTVTEREAAATVAIGGELYLATRDGDLFKKIGADDPSDLPLVTGILPAQVTGDRAGVVITIKRVLDVAEEADRVGLGKRYPIEELHVDKGGSLTVIVGREAIALAMGQPPYRDKVEEAARILGEVARRKANASVIFLDNEAHPERVVVRMR